MCGNSCNLWIRCGVLRTSGYAPDGFGAHCGTCGRLGMFTAMNQSVAPKTRSGWRWRLAGAGAVLVAAAVVWMLVRPDAGAPTSDKDTAVPPLVTVVVP